VQSSLLHFGASDSHSAWLISGGPGHAGLFLGIGVSLMVALYGVVGWSTAMPDLIIVLGVILGLGVGLLPARTVGAVMVKKTKSEYSSLSS
jgi:hypothetical protein